MAKGDSTSSQPGMGSRVLGGLSTMSPDYNSSGMAASPAMSPMAPDQSTLQRLLGGFASLQSPAMRNATIIGQPGQPQPGNTGFTGGMVAAPAIGQAIGQGMGQATPQQPYTGSAMQPAPIAPTNPQNIMATFFRNLGAY